KILIMGRDFNSAFPTYRAVIVFGTGIIEFPTINIHIIVVKSLIHGAFCGSNPVAVILLYQTCSSSASKAETHLYTVCCRSENLKAGITVRIYLRIFLTRLIK